MKSKTVNLNSDKMSYRDLLKLKATEDVLEKYYNSGSFKETLGYILKTRCKKCLN